MNLFTVNQDTCLRDGICAAVCPAGLIESDADGYPMATADAASVCIRCGHCVAACPSGSLDHRVMKAADCPPAGSFEVLSKERCEHFLRSRRSVRNYQDRPVDRKTLQQLIELARFAPSGHNSQCVRWHVMDRKEDLHNLAAVVVDWMRWLTVNMPDFAAAMHVERTIGRWKAGVDVVLRGAPAVIVAHAEKDNRMAPAACTLALAYLELAAPGMDLGCCWAGYFNAAATLFPPMAQALQLPEGHQSFGAMMVGYPKYSYHRLPLRKAPRITWR